MASTRLTKVMRKDIHAALMKRAFVERKADLDKREADLALWVYNLVYDEKTQALMAQLGSDFFHQRRGIQVRFGHDDDRLNMQDARLFAYQHEPLYKCTTVLNDDAPICDTYRAWKKDKRQYLEEYQKLKNEARDILERCTTVKQLCETWPEICPLLHDMGIRQNKEVRMLPAVRKDMNKLFQLPPRRCGNCNMTAIGDGPVCPYEGEVTEDYTCPRWEPIQDTKEE